MELDCQLHPDKPIQFICRDIDCVQKIFCETCLFEDKEFEHDIQDYHGFIENIDSGIIESFQGNNLIAKENQYNISQKKIMKELVQYYEDKIDRIIQQIQDVISEELDQFRKEFIIVIKKKADQILSSKCVSTCIFKNRMREELQKTLKTGDQCEISSNIIDMHNGSMEIKFAQEKLTNSVKKIQEEIKSGLAQSAAYFQSNIKECQDYLLDYLQNQSPEQPQSSQQNVNEEIQKFIQKSPNSKTIITKIKQQLQHQRNSMSDFSQIKPLEHKTTEDSRTKIIKEPRQIKEFSSLTSQNMRRNMQTSKQKSMEKFSQPLRKLLNVENPSQSDNENSIRNMKNSYSMLTSSKYKSKRLDQTDAYSINKSKLSEEQLLSMLKPNTSMNKSLKYMNKKDFFQNILSGNKQNLVKKTK